jgi:hypothetical protein
MPAIRPKNHISNTADRPIRTPPLAAARNGAWSAKCQLKFINALLENIYSR